jgi:hypothetical protein
MEAAVSIDALTQEPWIACQGSRKGVSLFDDIQAARSVMRSFVAPAQWARIDPNQLASS